MMTHFDDQLHLYVLVHVDTLCFQSTTYIYDLDSQYKFISLILKYHHVFFRAIVFNVSLSMLYSGHIVAKKGLLNIFSISWDLMILSTYLDNHSATFFDI